MWEEKVTCNLWFLANQSNEDWYLDFLTCFLTNQIHRYIQLLSLPQCDCIKQYDWKDEHVLWLGTCLYWHRFQDRWVTDHNLQKKIPTWLRDWESLEYPRFMNQNLVLHLQMGKCDRNLSRKFFFTVWWVSQCTDTAQVLKYQRHTCDQNELMMVPDKGVNMWKKYWSALLSVLFFCLVQF